MTYFIGADNGVTGSVAIISSDDTNFIKLIKTPVKECLNYTKEAKHIHRVDIKGLREFIRPYKFNSKCMIERPLVNPMMFTSTLSAIRALEATLIVLEELEIPYEYIDSKKWQHLLLPKECYKETVDRAGRTRLKGDKKKLKFESCQVAKRIFPSVTLPKGCDGDALLIAEYLRRQNCGYKGNK